MILKIYRYIINMGQQNIGLNLRFILYKNKKKIYKEIPRDNADMSNEKE